MFSTNANALFPLLTYLVPPMILIPLNFQPDLWDQKTIQSLCYHMAVSA